VCVSCVYLCVRGIAVVCSDMNVLFFVCFLCSVFDGFVCVSFAEPPTGRVCVLAYFFIFPF
jgi:hypothetical protein